MWKTGVSRTLLLLCVVSLVGCREGARGPTDPEPVATPGAVAAQSQVVVEASHAGGNGGGHGHGGGGTIDPSHLTLQVSPDHWNTNYSHSAGVVTAFVRGADLSAIDLHSIVLVGDQASATPLAPSFARVEGDHLRTQFPKSAVLDLLQDPTPGSTHTVTLRFNAQGVTGPIELTAKIVIVGPGGGGDDGGQNGFALQIQPDAWNTNWLKSSGRVGARITGPGLKHIDLGSIVLVGTDPAAADLKPLRANREGNHVLAQFAMSDAFKTLKDPKPGDRDKIIVKFTVDGNDVQLTDTIRVVGPPL